MEPRDVFVSHAEEDGPTARALARELRAQHQSTWTYEEDGVAGISYLTQIYAAIESCRAFVLIASPKSVKAHQVTREVERAYEQEKVIIAVRVGMTHQEFAGANPILTMACGTAVTLSADEGNLAEIANRIAATLQFAGSPQGGQTGPPVPVGLPSQVAPTSESKAKKGRQRGVTHADAVVPSQNVPAVPVKERKQASAVAQLLVLVFIVLCGVVMFNCPG